MKNEHTRLLVVRSRSARDFMWMRKGRRGAADGGSGTLFERCMAEPGDFRYGTEATTTVRRMDRPNEGFAFS